MHTWRSRDQRFVRLSEDSVKNKASWWDRLAFLLLAVAIAAVIFVSVAYAGPLWARFDLMILRTDVRRYLFAGSVRCSAVGNW